MNARVLAYMMATAHAEALYGAAEQLAIVSRSERMRALQRDLDERAFQATLASSDAFFAMDLPDQIKVGAMNAAERAAAPPLRSTWFD